MQIDSLNIMFFSIPIWKEYGYAMLNKRFLWYL